MRLNKIISIFMISLIIGIPFHISSVFATTGHLSELNVTGESGLGEILSQTDTLEVGVTAKMYDDAGSPMALNQNNVRLIIEGDEDRFTSCTGQEGAYRCIYASGERDWDLGKNNFEVKLYDNYFSRLDMISGAFYVDSTPPEIERFDIEKKDTGEVLVDYEVVDYACIGCLGYCSGLDRIEFSFDGDIKETLSDLTGCSQASTITFNPGSLGLEEGTLDFCITAYDMFGSENSACKEFFLDLTPPQFSGFSIKYDGNPVEYSSPLPMEVEISVNISDSVSGVSKTEILGDFSELNTIMPEKYSKMTPTCRGPDDALECRWTVLMDGVDGQANIIVDATDKSGLEGRYTKSLNLPMDNDAPSIVSIDTSMDNADEEKYIKKQDNMIVAQIDESESGMDNKDAYLNLYDLDSSSGSLQADSCNQTTGFWYCYWNSRQVTGKSNGQEVDVWIEKLIDDVGNRWLGEKGIDHETFIYDDEMPRFINMSISPIGADIEILRETDIAEITAYIEEGFSGLKAENVLADMSQFLSTEGDRPADSCEETSEGIWLCKWEYSGNYDTDQTVKLTVSATDNAGNTKLSSMDSVFGVIYIAKITEKTNINFWEDEAESYDSGKLNRNFLFMSSSGTFIRSGVRLVPVSTGSYVHAFDLTDCEGTLVIPNADDIYEAYSIKDQFYYPDVEKSDKYVLINVPHYDNNSLYEATHVRIICRGEIIQGKSKNSDVYTPNEEVNVTINVQLTEELFSRPDVATIDKITEKEDQLEGVTNLINWIEFWVDLLQPLCTLFQLIRQLIDGICVLMSTTQYFNIFSSSGVKECALQSWKLDKYWYGKEGSADKDLSSNFIPKSRKHYISVGYWCDLVLCEDCDDFWKTNVGDKLNEKLNGFIPGQIKGAVNFNPEDSLLVAVWCNPPCLPGILAKLKDYKAVLITYNVCLNIASVNPEYDISECEDYYDTQVCNYIVGEFWYLIDRFLKSYIVNYAMWLLNEKILHMSKCPEGWPTNQALTTACLGHKIYAIIGWFVNLSETIDTLNEIAEHQYFADEEAEEDIQEEITGKSEEDDEFLRR